MRSREALRRRTPALLLAITSALSLMLVSCETPSPIPNTLHVDDLPRLGYVEEVRIGNRDDPDAGFSRIGDIEVAVDGTVYVVEAMAREVRVFSPDGRRIRTIGGPGEGPGEFGRPSSIGLAGDTLWVRDSRRQRISWFGSDGTLVHETPGITLPVETDVPGMRLQVVLGDPRADGFVGSGYRLMMGGGAADRPLSYPVVRFDRNGAIVDTLRWDTVRLGPTVRVGGRTLPPPSLRPTSPVEVMAGDERLKLRWWTSEKESDGILEVVRIDVAGDTLSRTGLRYHVMSLPGSVRDSLLDLPEGMGQVYGISDRALRAAMASGLDLPDHRPPLRTTVVGRDRSLWVELNGESSDSTAWVLFHPDLTPRGRLLLPARLRPRHIDGPTVWAVELDDLDVPWLVRLRVQ